MFSIFSAGDKNSSRSSRAVRALTCIAILSGAVAALGILLASTAGASILVPAIDFGPGDYDNTANTVSGTNASPVYTNTQTTGSFRDVFWWGTAFNGGTAGVGSPDFINSGQNLVTLINHAAPGGNDTALNFTALRTSGGASLLSIYDTTPGVAGGVGPGQNGAGQNVFDAAVGLIVSADVLFAPGNHNASGGVVALYNEGQDGLALLANNGGGNNPDVPKLSLIFQHNGAPTTLASISLDPDGGGGGLPFLGDTNAANPLLGDHWYRIVMDLLVTGDTWTVLGSFFNHSDPENPNSELGPLIANLNFSGSVSNPDAASLLLTNPGEVGLMAFTPENFNDGLAIGGTGANPGNDNMGVSLTNFQVETPGAVPEPMSMLVWALLIGCTGFVTARKSRRWTAAA